MVSNRMRNWSSVLLAAVVLSVVAAAVSSSLPGWRPDGWITTKATIALATSGFVSAWDVRVDTTDGRVTLSGIVDSEITKEDAQTIVGTVEGVHQVNNLLQVVPPSEREVPS